MNNNYYFNPNPSFMRGIPNAMPMMRNQVPLGMTRTASVGLPRLSSLFSGAKLGGVGARAAGGAIGAASGASKLTFSGLLSGASKTLGVINQAIPVFYQVKPIWNNAKTMFRVVKEINSDAPKSKQVMRQDFRGNSNQIKEAEISSPKEENTTLTQKKEEDNSPTFFV